MRILDEKTNKGVNLLTLLLKKQEAEQLVAYLNLLLESESSKDHHHLSNDDYSKEITIALYEENDIEHFSDRCKELILHDK